jgi:glycosyltransferase involved in cell wall biosynthesis
MVSVALTAYKAERSLPKAIDSILAQRISLPLEIIVSDDCSPDRAGEIARAYQQRHPRIVRAGVDNIASRTKNLLVSVLYEVAGQVTGVQLCLPLVPLLAKAAYPSRHDFDHTPISRRQPSGIV